MSPKFMFRWPAVLVVSVLLAGWAQAVIIETVSVGNLANVGEGSGNDGGWGPSRVCGAIDYKYDMDRFEVTSGQYVEFLNAVAVTDTYGLYNANMPTTTIGVQGPEIIQGGSPGSYTYTVHPARADRPVCYVSWGDAARFVNWLHNGQPTGAQNLSTTEDGAYYLNGATSDAQLIAVTRESDWKWALPTEDEWYKAAYHKNDGDTGNYWDYATGADIGAEPGYVTDGDLLSGPLTPFTDGSADPGNYATWDGDGGQDGLGPFAYRTEVGEWENSASAYGTFDQNGNVWEWTEAVFDGDPTKRHLRGGGHISGALDMQSRFRNWGFLPAEEWFYIGFRVVRPTPPKGTAIIVR